MPPHPSNVWWTENKIKPRSLVPSRDVSTLKMVPPLSKFSVLYVLTLPRVSLSIIVIHPCVSLRSNNMTPP